MLLNKYVFEDFSRIDPHYLMLRDEVRMNSYINAVNSAVKKDDTVIDIGCGTGILSFVALQAGARKVYAVEKTDIIHTAELIAKK